MEKPRDRSNPIKKGGSQHSQLPVHISAICPQGPESAAQVKDPGAAQASEVHVQGYSLSPGCSLTSCLTDKLLRETSHFLRKLAGHSDQVASGQETGGRLLAYSLNPTQVSPGN